jgi:sugar lactone lactonase YvrE
MKLLLSLLAVTALCASAPASLSAQSLEPVAFFDGSANEYPEGITVDRQGNTYLSLVFAGKIVKVTPDGVKSDYASIPDNWLLGMTFDHQGNLNVIGASGVWKVTSAGVATLFAPIPGHSFINDLAADNHGNLYVTDSFRYAIWKVDALGNATIWSEDPLLQGAVSIFPNTLGPNGIRFTANKKTLIVANTSAGSLLAIDVRRDGSASPARVIATDPSLVGADGIELDHCDNTYIAVNIQDRIARVTKQGQVSTVIEGDILATPTALVFGRGRDSRSLYISNNGNVFFSSTPLGQGVIRLDLEDCLRRNRGNCRK